MTTDLAFEEETLWRNLHQPATAVPFIECVESLGFVTAHAGPLDVRTLQDGIADIVRRHPVLQSCFSAHGSGAQRLMQPVPDDLVRRFDLRDLPGPLREERAAHLANADVFTPFDLTSGPLLRVAAITLSDQRHVVAFTAHHLVVDGPSLRVLRREVNTCLGTQPVDQLEPSLPYEEYIAWQRRQLSGARLDRLRTYWMRTLDGLTDRRLPAAGPYDPASTCSSHVRFTIRSEDSDVLRRQSVERRVTISTALLALLAIVIHELTDSADVVVGLPVSSRSHKDFENTMGLCVNAVAVRTDLTRYAGFADLLTGLWSAVVDAYQHRAYPCEHLATALGARSGDGPPPFRVVFNFTRAATTTPALPGLVTGDLAATRDPASVADLSLHVRDDEETLDCCVLYKADRFSEPQIADLVDRFKRVAGEVARNPNRSVSRLVHS